MVYAPDTPTWRVYSAEESLPWTRSFPSVDHATSYVQAVLTSTWWRRRFPHVEQIEVVEGGFTSTDNDHIASFAHPHDRVDAIAWTINVHPRMLDEMVVLHELAHCACPRWEADVDALRRREASLRPTHHHGRLFAATMTELVEEFASAGPNELAEAYTHFEVDLAPTDAVDQAIANLPEIEAFLRPLMQPSVPDNSEHDGQQQTDDTSQRGSVPEWSWGDHLLIPRRVRHRPMIPQQALAEQISTIERCTRRDISRIERATTRPTDPRDLRIAMAMAACLGLDPLHARYVLSLVRWDCHTDLAELRLIAPSWVEHVEHLNALVAAQPPQWSVLGDR